MRLRTLLGCGLLALSSAAGAAEVTIELTAVQVEDGDTVIAELEGASQRIQLLGIDAPEESDNPKLAKDLERTGLARDRLIALGQAATRHLRELLADKGRLQLRYDPDKPDRYKRPQGLLLDGGAPSLSHAMVADGFARATDAGDAATTEALRSLEATARAENRGVWGLDPEAAQAWAGR